MFQVTKRSALPITALARAEFVPVVEDNGGQRVANPDVMQVHRDDIDGRPAEFPGKVSKDLPNYYPWWEPRKFSAFILMAWTMWHATHSLHSRA